MSILHDTKMYLFTPSLNIEFTFHCDFSIILLFVCVLQGIQEIYYNQVEGAKDNQLKAQWIRLQV